MQFPFTIQVHNLPVNYLSMGDKCGVGPARVGEAQPSETSSIRVKLNHFAPGATAHILQYESAHVLAEEMHGTVRHAKVGSTGVVTPRCLEMAAVDAAGREAITCHQVGTGVEDRCGAPDGPTIIADPSTGRNGRVVEPLEFSHGKRFRSAVRDIQKAAPVVHGKDAEVPRFDISTAPDTQDMDHVFAGRFATASTRGVTVEEPIPAANTSSIIGPPLVSPQEHQAIVNVGLSHSAASRRTIVGSNVLTREQFVFGNVFS